MTTNENVPQYVDPQMALAHAVAQHTRLGWRVESYGPGQVTLANGHSVNHILHLILTLVTLGLWAPVWLLLTFTVKESRTVIAVDSWGRTYRADGAGAPTALPV